MAGRLVTMAPKPESEGARRVRRKRSAEQEAAILAKKMKEAEDAIDKGLAIKEASQEQVMRNEIFAELDRSPANIKRCYLAVMGDTFLPKQDLPSTVAATSSQTWKGLAWGLTQNLGARVPPMGLERVVEDERSSGHGP